MTCRACNQTTCNHPDPVYLGLVPTIKQLVAQCRRERAILELSK